jgi:GTP-binding protein
MAVSAVSGENVRKLLYAAAELLDKVPELPTPAEEMAVYRAESDPNEFRILSSPEGWKVEGVSIERAAAMTYWEYDQSVRRFQRILETLGIDQALRDAGVEPGDTVSIGGHELEWQD